MEFNHTEIPRITRDDTNDTIAIEAYQLYEITENIEEYYRQKAPNLWNAWIRTNNMLVEQQEKINKLENTLNTINKNILIGGNNDGIVNNNVLNFEKKINERMDKLDNNINKIKDYLLKQNSMEKQSSR